MVVMRVPRECRESAIQEGEVFGIKLEAGFGACTCRGHDLDMTPNECSSCLRNSPWALAPALALAVRAALPTLGLRSN